MLSPLPIHSAETLGYSSLLSYRAPRRQANYLSSDRAAKGLAQRSSNRSFNRPADADLEKDLKYDTLSRQLLEILPQGVLVISCNFNLLFWNKKAKEICFSTQEAVCGSHLPPSILESCHQMIREDLADQESLVRDYLAPNGQTIRMTVRWLENLSENTSRFFDRPKLIDRDRHGQETHPSQSLQAISYGKQVTSYEALSPMVVFLENCDEVLQEDLRVQQKKYDLTERESEIWRLLRKEHSYQEIAEILQISLNTVKTHVKNIYAKRRSCQDQETFWCG